MDRLIQGECDALMATTCSPRAARLVKVWAPLLGSLAVLLAYGPAALAGEADLAIPDLHEGKFTLLGMTISAWNLLFYGAFVICGTLGISLYLREQIRRLPAHRSMLNVAE